MNWGRLSAVQEAMRARIPAGRAGRAQGSSGPSTWPGERQVRPFSPHPPPSTPGAQRPRAPRSARDAGVVFTSGGSSSLRLLRLLLSRLPVRHLPRRGLPAATPRTSRPRPVTMETRRRGRGGSLERPGRAKTELQNFISMKAGAALCTASTSTSQHLKYFWAHTRFSINICLMNE